MIDAPAVLHDYLLAQTPLTALTAARIWAELDTPPKNYQPVVGAALVFKRAGGRLAAVNAHLQTRWQFKVYGPHVYVIDNVYTVLMDVLHDVRCLGGILSSYPETTGVLLSEEDSNWPFMLLFVETTMLSGLPLHTPS